MCMEHTNLMGLKGRSVRRNVPACWPSYTFQQYLVPEFYYFISSYLLTHIWDKLSWVDSSGRVEWELDKNVQAAVVVVHTKYKDYLLTQLWDELDKQEFTWKISRLVGHGTLTNYAVQAIEYFSRYLYFYSIYQHKFQCS